MRVMRVLAGSLRFWAMVMLLSAGFVISLPRVAEASCYPCGPNSCVGPGGGCYGVDSGICWNGTWLVCEFRPECPTWHMHGFC